MSAVSRVLALCGALVAGTTTSAATVPLDLGWDSGAALVARTASRVESDVAHRAAAATTAQEASSIVLESQQILTKEGMVHLPRTFRATGQQFDLVVHFHGPPHVLGAAMEKAGVEAALLVYNRDGIVQSSAYDGRYAAPGSLDKAVAAVEDAIAQSGVVQQPKVRRIALSGWSAGGGAVYRLLTHPAVAARVDAVLVEDGLHAAFVKTATRELDPLKLAPFVRLAEQAAHGDKLFGLTHSSIPTFDHGSTTETAAYLAGKVGVNLHAPAAPRDLGTRPGEKAPPAAPPPGEPLKQTLGADRGDFHVQGFEGTSKGAHCAQLLKVDQTLMGYLAARWNRPSKI